MDNIKIHTLAVLVDNASGVLSQVTRLFSRKGCNIESLAVGATDDPAVSRITIEIKTDDARAKLLCNQLRKLIPVHSVKHLEVDNEIRRELVLIKVRADTSAQRNEIIQIANIFRASIIDVSLGSLTLAVIGTENKTDAIQKLVSEFGILELVRTGMVALERGLHTINEETKEKGEFDYGKNVL
ncbi:MAG: acetolactate synthase small subunit [Victivallales bacterium]|nr:acetolactate synthase small subunit [Victivallales bacterium]